MKALAAAVAGALLVGCADPYWRGPTIIGGWNVSESKEAKALKEGPLPPGSTVRFAPDCQYTLLGAIPYWGWAPSVEEARERVMKSAPATYTSTSEGLTWIYAWNFIFVFQSQCVELTIRFEGVPE